MSYVSQPPGYDQRRQPNGEPPGYLDTSQRDFPRDAQRGYIPDDRGYPLNDRGYSPDMRGYVDDRDFRLADHQAFPAEFPEHDRGYGIPHDDRYRGRDMSYDSQPMAVYPGHDAGEFRDDDYDRARSERPLMHVDRAYATTDPASVDDYTDMPQRYHVRHTAITYSETDRHMNLLNI